MNPTASMPRVAWRPLPTTADVLEFNDEFARRGLNIIAALVGIVITAPLMAIIALLVRLSSPGPILFAQTRIGIDRRARHPADAHVRRHRDLGGHPFVMYKFRTMYVAPGDQMQHVWALADDSRITRIGRILRKFRLDELPQLFNVLRGDMNVVGPRPEQPDIFLRLRGELHGYGWRQWVRPGITGWAQIHVGYDASTDDVRRKLEYDLDYIRRRSPLHDLAIMLRTIPVMVGRKGAI